MSAATTTERLPHQNVVVIGHVDVGKSSLCGQILVQSGQIDKRTLDKCVEEAKANNRVGWELAYLMDTDENEKAKGKTITVGKASFETKTRRFTFLDSPGHKLYVNNAYQGIAQADYALLIVSARAGEFESGFLKEGQTKEHIVLAKTVGVSHIVVLINKMDEKTVNWSTERYNEIMTNILKFLLQKGFKKNEITFCPCSGYTGANVKDRHYPDQMSLFEILDSIPLPIRNAAAPVKMAVFNSDINQGLMNITGKLETGTITKGQKLLLQPTNTEVVATDLVIDGESVDKVTSGENVTILTNSIKNSAAVQQGDVLCDSKTEIKISNKFKAEIFVMDIPETLLTVGYKCMLHIHNATVECEITKLVSRAQKDANGSKGKLRVLLRGDLAKIEITTDAKIAFDIFAAESKLSRFVLRNGDKTIAIGKVIG